MRTLVLFFLLLFIATSTDAQLIGASYYHSVFRCANGTVMAMGANDQGQLGDGTIIDKFAPVPVLGISDVKSISVGLVYSLFLKNDGTVWACGANSLGQLGDSSNVNRTFPVKVAGISGVIAIASKYSHSIFLKNDGTVWACGGNGGGALGDGTSINRNYPVQVLGLTGIKAIAAGTSHSLFVKNDGTVWACGYNNHGQIGDGTTTNQLLPKQVPGLTGIVAVNASEYYSLFLKNDGSVWACGINDRGQLGDGTTIERLTPVQVSGLSGITSIAAGVRHSLFVKNDGTLWACGDNNYGNYGDGSQNNSTVPVLIPAFSGVAAVSAGTHSLFLKNNSTVWGCGYNFYGQYADTSVWSLVPIQINNACTVAPGDPVFSHMIHGYIFADSTQDCNKQISEKTIPFIAVSASPGNYFGFADSTGKYSLGINDSINYIVKPIIPAYYTLVNNACPPDYKVSLNASSPNDTNGFDFGFDYPSCSQLRIDIVSSLKRPCTSHATSVYFINEGPLTALNVTAHVLFPSNDIPWSSNMPYLIDPTDSSLVFNIGTLKPWESGNIIINDSIPCDFSIVGLTKCTKAWILPVNQCLKDSSAGPNWDKSSLKVTGSCVNDTVRFVIYNHGSGNMATPSWYRIYEDNILVDSTSFQLAAGDSLVVLWAANGKTIRLEADQNPGHPGYSHPRATIEACGLNSTGTFSRGKVNLVPQDDLDIDVEIDCRAIQNSFDPNEKLNSPEGIDASHLVLPSTHLDFTINFQNTGTDTAFKVVIMDTLSTYLDLSSIELGTSSHPYKLSLSGQGTPILKFIFDDINLLDSTHDEPNSHGFVKYKITPKAGTPLGTRINNAADIYFDYNFPVRTNTAFVTLGTYPLSTNVHSISSVSNSISVFPNPTTGEFKVQSSKLTINKIELFNVVGEKVYEMAVEVKPNVSVGFESVSHLPSGIYFLSCITEKGSERLKIVKQ